MTPAMQYDLRAGDIGGIRSTGLFGKLIRWKKRKEGPEQTSHVWRVVEDGKFPAGPGDKHAMIVEALVREGVAPPASMTEHYGDKLDQIWIARPINLTDREIGEVIGWTLGQVGKKYSIAMIWRHLFGSEGGIKLGATAICSWLVSMAERERLEKDWGLAAAVADPADIERHIMNYEGRTHIWIKRPPWGGVLE